MIALYDDKMKHNLNIHTDVKVVSFLFVDVPPEIIL